jgi:hypothetical protein
MPRATQRKHGPSTIASVAQFLAVLSASVIAANTSLLFVGACVPETPDSAADESPSGSLIAVGDTGSPWGFAPQLFEGQLAVGIAIQKEHARSPIDAFVLLGDNFYPSGLRAGELLPRIVDNIARPYCALIEASDELARRLDPACLRDNGPRPRLFAVIGNHDLITPESERLQRKEVPGFVLNWDMPSADTSRIRELPGGLSLIFLHSGYPWGEAEVEQLSSDLRSAKGPWRVLIGHRPPIAGHPQLSRMVARAAELSGRVVHAYLAGHVHVVAAIPGVVPAPALTVIAGSGSHARRQEEREYRIEQPDLLVEELGFMRLDVMGTSPTDFLRVTLFQAPASAALSFLGNTVLARYHIERDGRVERQR